jgi:hypothetical protein
MFVLPAPLFAFAALAARAPAGATAERLPAVAAGYKIVDVGVPSTIGTLGRPIAFNNSGQIVGTVIEANLVTHCVAWTGTAMLDFGNAQSLSCYPSSGITDADPAGTFKIVGKTSIPTESGNIAFLATVSPKSVSLALYTANVPSWLYAMNASGYAAGTAQWSPVKGFSTSSPPFVTTGGNLSLLQPACVVASASCMSSPYFWNFSGASRSIDSAGTILGNPTGFTSWPTLVEYNATKPSLSHTFTLPTVNGAKPNYSVGIDDAGLVYYTANLTAFKSLLFRYNPTTKAATFLGYIPGDTACSTTFVAVNKSGEALLAAGGCKSSANNGYWTWDENHGFRAVTAINGASYGIVTMTNINDKGQILASLTATATNEGHWGYFTPI